MLKSHTENELISTFEDTEKMLYVVCLIKLYRMLNCAIDLPKILGNFEHRQEYISRIPLQLSKTILPNMHFPVYINCKSRTKAAYGAVPMRFSWWGTYKLIQGEDTEKNARNV
jgi:hypothetical protein